MLNVTYNSYLLNVIMLSAETPLSQRVQQLKDLNSGRLVPRLTNIARPKEAAKDKRSSLLCWSDEDEKPTQLTSKIGGRKKRAADFETFETKTENVGSAESGEFDEPGRPKLNKDGVKIGLNIVVDVKQPERRNKGSKAKGFRRSPFREENEAVDEEEPVFPFGRLSLDEAERLIHFFISSKTVEHYLSKLVRFGL
jgi:hypothetical protein